MAKKKREQPFDVKTFLSTVDGGRTILNYRKKQKSSLRDPWPMLEREPL
jgi:hypothetical protein